MDAGDAQRHLSVRQVIAEDIRRTYEHVGGGTLKRMIWCFRTPGLHAIVTYRVGHWLLRQPLLVRLFLKPLYVYQWHRMRAKWGIEISPYAKIGKGMLVYHFGGVIIGSEAVIGENFSVSHDVTIGLSGQGPRRGAPTIGDNVYVAPGARIAGRIRIGHHAKIGANVVIEKDVPDYALVQVAPPKMMTFPGFYGQSKNE